MSPANTSGDGSATGLCATGTPVGGLYIAVVVNGVLPWVADGNAERGTADCYFSSDGGVNAKSYGNFAAGDCLYWNGTQAGYELVNGTHFVDFLYAA